MRLTVALYAIPPQKPFEEIKYNLWLYYGYENRHKDRLRLKEAPADVVKNYLKELKGQADQVCYFPSKSDGMQIYTLDELCL